MLRIAGNVCGAVSQAPFRAELERSEPVRGPSIRGIEFGIGYHIFVYKEINIEKNIQNCLDNRDGIIISKILMNRNL